ncbi:MAG: hypothetical protein NT154_03150 [Verrucomicrobia bacterium]|nr:hypothetical protein [Verrucomicrobiota bacterium]
MVAVPALCDLKDTLLKWFTFFEHFDGVKLDWTSVRSAELNFTNNGTVQLHEPISWLKRQQVRFVTDFSSGLASGDLTLQENAPGTKYQESVAAIGRVMDKLAVLGRATDLIISAEEVPGGQTASVRAGVARFCSLAAVRGMEVHFKHRTTSWTPDVAATLGFISSVGAKNLKFAASTAESTNTLERLLARAGGQLGLILIVPPTNGVPVDLSPVRSRSTILLHSPNRRPARRAPATDKLLALFRWRESGLQVLGLS